MEIALLTIDWSCWWSWGCCCCCCLSFNDVQLSSDVPDSSFDDVRATPFLVCCWFTSVLVDCTLGHDKLMPKPRKFECDALFSRIIQPKKKTHLSGDSCHATNAAAWAPHRLHWIFYDAQHLPFSHSAARYLKPPTAHLRSVQSVDADCRWPHSYHRCYLLLALQCVKHRIKSLVRDMCVRRATKKNQNIKRNWSFPYLCNSRMETEPTLSSWCYSCRCFCYDELKCCLNYSYCHFQRRCPSRSRRRYFCW